MVTLVHDCIGKTLERRKLKPRLSARHRGSATRRGKMRNPRDITGHDRDFRLQPEGPCQCRLVTGAPGEVLALLERMATCLGVALEHAHVTDAVPRFGPYCDGCF